LTLAGLLALATCTLQMMSLDKPIAALDSENEPARLEAASVAIATSGNAEAIARLAKHLGQGAFLRRLDPEQDGQPVVDHIYNVFRALADHPNAATEALCLALSRAPDFTALSDRMNLLLNALAAVRPMSKEAAAIFRETSRSEYLGVNGPLLARNASPLALAVLEDLLLEETLAAEDRVDMAHHSLLPMRTHSDVVGMCARVALSRTVAPEVREAVTETLFDYQPRAWFGVSRNQPRPPTWKSASPQTRRALQTLGRPLLSQPEVSVHLRKAIAGTLAQLR
jgi:hypothetical protein